MAIIKQGILGGFKKKIGSVVGSSWKGIATMRSLPLSVANPKTAAQVSNRNRFKACAEFASQILASIIKPLMDRFAGQMSGYNYFTQLNKEVFANPSAPVWGDLVISKGKMIAPVMDSAGMSGSKLTVDLDTSASDRYGLPSDKIYGLIVGSTSRKVLFAGDTGATRQDGDFEVELSDIPSTETHLKVYMSFLRADGSEVSNSSYFTQDL